MQDDHGNLIISFIVSGTHKYAASMCLQEMKDIDEIIVDTKKYKTERSYKQNDMLWALLEKITLATTGYTRKDDVYDCYINLLEQANIDCKFRVIMPEDKASLEKEYRVIKKVAERTIAESGVTLDVYRCYIGSSKFNTKQMAQLIDLALDTLSMLNVNDSDIESIRQENIKLNKGRNNG